MVKPLVAPSVIRRWVEERLGPVARFHHLTEGEESQAFAFTHGGGDYVVRVRSELGGFAKERFAAERFGGQDLPIPEVLTLGRLEVGDPLYDIANVLFWAPWLECMRIQADHFEAVLPAGAEVWERLRCYQVRIGLREMLHHALHDPDAHLAWLTDRTMACAGAPRRDGV